MEKAEQYFERGASFVKIALLFYLKEMTSGFF